MLRKSPIVIYRLFRGAQTEWKPEIMETSLHTGFRSALAQTFAPMIFIGRGK